MGSSLVESALNLLSYEISEHMPERNILVDFEALDGILKIFSLMVLDDKLILI